MSNDNLSVLSASTNLMIDDEEDEIQDETLKSFIHCNCKTCLEMYQKSSSYHHHSSKANFDIHHNDHHEGDDQSHHHQQALFSDHSHYDDISSHHFYQSNEECKKDKQLNEDVLSNFDDALTVMSIRTTRSHPMFPSNIYDNCLYHMNNEVEEEAHSKYHVEDDDDEEDERRSFHKVNRNNFKFDDDLEFEEKAPPLKGNEKESNDDIIFENEVNDEEKALEYDEKEDESEKKVDETHHDEDDFMNIDGDEDEAKRVIIEETELIIDDIVEEEEKPLKWEVNELEFDDVKSVNNETIVQELRKNEEIQEDEELQMENNHFEDNVSNIHEDIEFSVHGDDKDQIESVNHLEQVENIESDESNDQQMKLETNELNEDEPVIVNSSVSPILEQVEDEKTMIDEIPSITNEVIEDIVEEREVIQQDNMDDDISIEISIDDLNYCSPTEMAEPIHEEVKFEDEALIQEKVGIISCFIKGYLDRKRLIEIQQSIKKIQSICRNYLNIRRRDVVHHNNLTTIQSLLLGRIVRKEQNEIRNKVKMITCFSKAALIRKSYNTNLEMIHTIQSMFKGKIYRNCLQNEKNNKMNIANDFCCSPNMGFDRDDETISAPPIEQSQTPKRKIDQTMKMDEDDDRITFFPPLLPKPFRPTKEKQVKKPKAEPKIEKELVIYNSKSTQNCGKISMIRHEIKRKNDEFYFDQVSMLDEIRNSKEEELNQSEKEDEPVVIVQPKKKMKYSKPFKRNSTPVFKRLDLTDDEIDQLIIQKEKLTKLDDEFKNLKEKEE